MKLSDAEKIELVDRYRSGTSIQSLAAETGIARSTLYTWVERHNKLFTSDCREITIQDFNGVKRHAQKLEHILEILKLVDCSANSSLQDKLAAIEAIYGNQYSVTELCEALNVPRGTFYNYVLRNKRGDTQNAQRRNTLRPVVKEIFNENNQMYGGAKIAAVMKERGYCVSKKYVLSLMHEEGLQSVCPHSKHDYQNWKKGENRNILQQRFQTDAPNRIWASDITVFKFHDCYYYTCAIIDLYSRKIIAYRISDHCSTQLISGTFKEAYQRRSPQSGLLFHSDRGSQYTSHSFSKLLKECDVVQSLSRPGAPHDNAVCEAFFAIFKKEELYRHAYHSVADMRSCINNYMDFYNCERLHTVLQYKTPEKYEELYWENKND